ncbi:MAG: hypothetical protein PHQ28_10935, partial [Mycobacterium sp.]|nr:hypothetical protein [Mycobacterium sp.]
NVQASLLFDQFVVTGNILHLLFLDPEAKNVWVNWESYAKMAIAVLHRAVGVGIEQPDIAELVRELSSQSSDFLRMWKSHDVDVSGCKIKRLRSRDCGELEFDYEILSAASAPGQFLVLHRQRNESLVAAEQSRDA